MAEVPETGILVGVFREVVRLVPYSKCRSSIRPRGDRARSSVAELAALLRCGCGSGGSKRRAGAAGWSEARGREGIDFACSEKDWGAAPHRQRPTGTRIGKGDAKESGTFSWTNA